MSRKTIGENPLDTLISAPKEKKTENNPQTNLNNKKYANGNKQRLTVQISEDTIERAKNAVYWTRGLTLAQLTEEALEKAIKNLEKNSVIYDDSTGRPLKDKNDCFPSRKEELKSGRPVK